MVKAFHADLAEGWPLFMGEWFTLKCFMGGWCCFGGNASPINSNTANNPFHFRVITKNVYAKYVHNISILCTDNSKA